MIGHNPPLRLLDPVRLYRDSTIHDANLKLWTDGGEKLFAEEEEEEDEGGLMLRTTSSVCRSSLGRSAPIIVFIAGLSIGSNSHNCKSPDNAGVYPSSSLFM